MNIFQGSNGLRLMELFDWGIFTLAWEELVS